MKESLELFEVNRETASPADVRPVAEKETLLVLKDIGRGRKGTRFTALINGGETDRDGESIDPSGWVMSAKAAPVFFGHAGYRDAANWIGTIDRLFLDGGLPYIDAELFDDVDAEKADTARFIAELLHKGVRPNGSVGFDPFAWTEKDGRKGSRNKGEVFPGPAVGRRYTKQDLLEWSIAPVTSDVDSVVVGLKALQERIGRGSPEGLAASLMALTKLADAPEQSPAKDETDEVAEALAALEKVWPEARKLVRRVLEERSSQERALTELERSLLDRFGRLPWQEPRQESAGLAGE